MSRTVVYAGPTISPDEVRAVLPDAEVRPPAARGDLLADVWAPGEVALVVDGFFRERRSVGHKEILWLLSEGVDVVGAASMGALRAVELGPCGMRGIGTVHGMYASGEIDGDDEVGVLHGPAAKGYPSRTVALVNLRYGVAQGVAAGTVDPDAGERVVAAVKQLPFTFRTWEDIAGVVDRADSGVLPVLREGIASGGWDVKRRDAVAALHAVAAGPAPGPRPTVPVTGISRTQLLERRTRRRSGPGREMSDLDVLDAARLFDPGYPAGHEAVLLGLLADLAAAGGRTVAEHAAAVLGHDDRRPLPDALAAWLTEAELARSAPGKLLPLVMVRIWPVWRSADWRPAVLDRLRADPRWPDWVDTVVRAGDAAEESRYRLVVPPPSVCALLFQRRWREPGSSAQIELARRGFTSAEEFGAAVRPFFALEARSARGSR